MTDCETATVVADYGFAERIEAVRGSVPAEVFLGYEVDSIEGDWEGYEPVVAEYPSPEWGETPETVVPRADANPTEDGIIEFVRDQVANYKPPTGLDFVEDLPETATGKVRKYELRKRCWEGEKRMVGRS